MAKQIENDQIAHIGIIGGSLTDLSCIDFSMVGFKIYHINDEGLLEYFKQHSSVEFAETNYKFITQNSKYDNGHEHLDSEFLNVMVPLSIKNAPDINAIYEAINALRLVHPSELAIRNIFHLQIENGKIYTGSFSSIEQYHIGGYEDLFKYYFKYPVKYISSTNDFLKIYFERIDRLNYVKNALKYYTGAFRINDPEMGFVSLCICLESIVPTAEQLSFRFRRNLAVLCGEDEFCSQVIYENAKLLYNYRSKLVHFGMKEADYRKFDDYFDYALLITSRMLIEMILHNIQDIETLDTKLNEIGFGQRSRLSENYTGFDGNLNSQYGILSKNLK